MRHLLTLALFLSLQTLHAQSPDRWEYCQITISPGGFNSETRASVDYGDKIIKALSKSPMLTDSAGSEFFKSPIHVFNFLGYQGWECIETQSSQSKGQTCLFKRRR